MIEAAMDTENATSRAFDGIFARFDPQNTGSINTKDFLNLIDELDALQPDEADPIISEDQRENALPAVEAAVPMSKSHLLEFLQELGVQLQDTTETEGPRHSTVATKVPVPDLMAESPSSVARPRPRVPVARPDRARKALRLVTPDVSAIEFENDDTAMFSDIASRPTGTAYESRRASTPLAQSTPQKSAKALAGKENRRPQSSPEKAPMQSMFSAVGEGAFSSPSASSPRSFSASFHDNLELRRLQDEIKSLQDRERTSDRTIAAGEHQIHQLETLLDENKKELAKSNRAVVELKSSFVTAEQNIHLLENEVSAAHRELTSWQHRHTRSKEDAEFQSSESEKYKSMCQDRTHKVEQLQANLASFDNERRLVRHTHVSTIARN